MLRGSDDVLVKIVGVIAVEYGVTCLLVEHERLACALFKTGDVLDAEAVSVEPWKENVTNDILHTILGETKSLSSDDRTVAKVETAGIGTIEVSDKKRIRVVLLGLGHLGSIFSKHDTIDNQVLERS